MLHDVNAYVVSLKMAKYILQNCGNHYKVVIRADRRPAGEHERRFNAHACNEVIVLMLNEVNGKRGIILRHQDASIGRITKTHRSYNALQYPLIFPRGEDGYSFSDYHVKDQQKVSSEILHALSI